MKESQALSLELEEIQLPHTVDLFLNVADFQGSPTWKRLNDLSTGQKATAILLLLLLESRAPLVVDQPEDDLDNRFISDSVVPKIREEKRRRQFVFATHNANIPVLGDSELIVGLTAVGDAISGGVTISRRHMGSIDSREIQALVEEILEGGQEAFEMRRLKYGFVKRPLRLGLSQPCIDSETETINCEGILAEIRRGPHGPHFLEPPRGAPDSSF